MDSGLQPRRATPSANEGAQSIGRALDLLVRVATSGSRGATQAELLADSSLKRPTFHRLLGALVRTGLVEQDNDSERYHLGAQSYVIGNPAAGRFRLHHPAVGAVARLAHLSGETAFLTLRRGNDSVCLHREEGTFPIRVHGLALGDRHPLGVGAGSIAILAAMPDDEVKTVLAANEARYRRRYPAITRARLCALIGETRARGFAVNPGLIHPGSWALGIGLHDADGVCTAALSIGAIESRLGEARQRELFLLMAEEARTVESSLRRRRPETAEPALEGTER